jgi:parvulin-like peptidyl-prolyl cis-trans isomerase-like protein
MRWLRAPLLHFLAGGGALFWLVHVRPAERPAAIVVTVDDIGRLRQDYTRDTGLEPTSADEATLVEKTIQEEVLFREAVARGLDRYDRSVRNWLVEQMRVLADDAGDDADGLYARARELGLDRTDLVVRRILVQKMRLLAARTGERPPTDTELAAFYAAHSEEYRPPDRVTFWHVLVRPGPDAEAALAGARREPPEEAVRHGDSFGVSPHVIAQSASQVAKVFGADVATTVESAEMRTWTGPVPSPYGVHLVWVEARERGTPPPLAAVRQRVVERWQDEERARRVIALVRELERRYPLHVESAAWREWRAS